MNPSSELPIGETFASDLEICYEVLLYLSSRLARCRRARRGVLQRRSKR